MQHRSNARADRYPPAPQVITADGPHTSTDVTPFCQIDSDGNCQEFWHSHPGPVALPKWALLRRLTK